MHVSTSKAFLLLLPLWFSAAVGQNFKQEDLDFADAEEDPATGQLCITRRYCLANTDALASRLPPQPCVKQFSPGCNCDVDGDCTAGNNATDTPYCADCVCSAFPQGCDCFGVADCDYEGYCVDCVCSPFAPGCNCEGDHDCDGGYCVDCTCSAFAAGCNCNADQDCPDNGYCVDCTCSAYPEGCNCNTLTDCPSGDFCVDCQCSPFAPGCNCDRDADCPNGGYCVDCTCSNYPAGCNCNSQSDCPSGDFCVDCQCSPYPPGCDCNTNGDCPNGGYCVDCNCNSFPKGCSCNVDSDCPTGDFCVDCNCSDYPAGCNCNTANDCGPGESCNDCKCSKFPPGCDCNVDGDCPDDGYCVDCKCSKYPAGCTCMEDSECGGGTNKCVNCNCMDCPVSTVVSNKVINPPLTFVVDTTKSVKPDKYSIFNLTQKVVQKIQDTDANIPSYLLVTFNDHGPDFRKNVQIGRETQDVLQFKQEIVSLIFESYDGGRDSKERLMQGLLGAVSSSPEKSLICVFTDNGSKDLKLKNEIIRTKQQKQITIYIVLTPIFEGFPNDPSLDTYAEVADQVFFISEVGAETFLTSVEEFEVSNCL